LKRANEHKLAETGDPEIATRIAQYEMAFRMQSSVPELTDLSKETAADLEMYGPDVRKAGTFAYNCLMARRLAERGVRFIQLYHRDWDHHGKLPEGMPKRCLETDQPAAALVRDLTQRGMLDDTLVVWGGEFGRTVYCQGRLTKDDYGRDHHPRCFSVWMAGGGIKPGLTYGATDDFSYNVTENPVTVHDLQATILHSLGIDHKKLTFKFQGRHYRLTDVSGDVVQDLLS
jgi:arylsulfatase A-like enzyme